MRKLLPFAIFIGIIFISACASSMRVSQEELKQKNYQEVFGLIDVSEVDTKPDKMPMYPRGNGGLINDIQKNLEYPQTAIDEGVEGNVIVAFTVSKKGEVKDLKVDKGVNAALNKAALSVMEKLQPWYPAHSNGEATDIRLKTLITFRLPQQNSNKLTQ